MYKLELLTNTKIKSLLNKRAGEIKLGQQVQLLSSVSNIYEQLTNLDVKYIIIGLPEDVGVFANYGKSGTCNAWESTLKILLNIQSNNLLASNKIAILGHLNFDAYIAQLSTLKQKSKKDIKIARALVIEIDKHVSALITTIVKANKIPIIIGGGHNNAYGNIKGTSLALNTPINVINFDAHSDFRAKEGRHSGNGFSYAFDEGFLDKYFIFGLHENYTSRNIFKELDKLKQIKYNTFEAIEIRKELKFNNQMKIALEFISNKPFGIEIDCDAIENIPSSAQTPSGFSVNKARRFVHHFGKHQNAAYLHICEAAPTKKTQTQIGKLITYFITDFIKAYEI